MKSKFSFNKESILKNEIACLEKEDNAMYKKRIAIYKKRIVKTGIQCELKAALH